jgi:dephospho-CoA kinase
MFIGLTGGVSSGKTVAGEWLTRHFDVFDADLIVHELYAVNQGLRQQMAERFGSGILLPDGVCRQTLRELIFADRSRLEDIGRIVHPFVTERLHEIMREKSRSGVRDCVFQIPLLFEKGWHEKLDYVLLIGCSREVQMERCRKRGMGNREEVLRIINSQLPLDEKKKLADYCIMNDGELENFYLQLQNWYDSFTKMTVAGEKH